MGENESSPRGLRISLLAVALFTGSMWGGAAWLILSPLWGIVVGLLSAITLLVIMSLVAGSGDLEW